MADDGGGATEGFVDGGYGLRFLTQRAASLGGVARTQNVPEGGFVLEVELPTGE